ncbi:hypothetical protein TWF730_010200 [Orbilia blumenaviensis]|uniref:Uncharacterized protein n=1 Tax=Orbilia blumenaviensis TaxID=1796055 RepID=A0AAV9URG7_9PEZI
MPITPTSGGSAQIPSTQPEESAAQVAAGMPFDIRLFVRARRIAAGGQSPSPSLLGEPRGTASPRPRSPLQRSRHGSEPLSEGLPVPLQPSSGSGTKKTTKSSRQSGLRPNATSSQRQSTMSRATRSRRNLSEAEADRLLDEARSTVSERLEREDQRRPGVEDDASPMTPPSARPSVAEQPTEDVNGEEVGPAMRRLIRRRARRADRIAREQSLEALANAGNINAQERPRGARRTVRRRRDVTTNTRTPAVGRNGRQLGADGRVAPVGGEPVPALQQAQRGNTNGRGRQQTRVLSVVRPEGGEQLPERLTRDDLPVQGHVLTMTNPAAEERYIRDLLELRRRVEETFVPEDQQAPAPAPWAPPAIPARRVVLTEIPMNTLNNGPVVLRGRQVRQGVVIDRQRRRQRPGAQTYQDNLRGVLGPR